MAPMEMWLKRNENNDNLFRVKKITFLLYA